MAGSTHKNPNRPPALLKGASPADEQTASGSALRMLFVDDHLVVRMALMQLISKAFPAAEIVPASTYAEGVDLLMKGEWQIAILEMSLKGRDGLDFLLQARGIDRRLPVLVLTIEREDQFAIRAMKLGAAGFLPKTCTWDELRGAIETILRGEKFISPWLAQRLAHHVGDRDQVENPHDALSDREFQVLRMLAAGKTVKEIGAELLLSVKTISTYRTRILEKMKFKSNSDIVSYCATHDVFSMRRQAVAG